MLDVVEIFLAKPQCEHCLVLWISYSQYKIDIVHKTDILQLGIFYEVLFVNVRTFDKFDVLAEIHRFWADILCLLGKANSS